MSVANGASGPSKNTPKPEQKKLPAAQETSQMSRHSAAAPSRSKHRHRFWSWRITLPVPTALRRMARKPRAKIGAGIVVVAVLALLGYALIPIGTPRTVHLAKAFTGNLVQTVATSGQLSSGVYNLSFFASGRIVQVVAKVGQKVKSGDVLAELDVTPLQDALTTAKAQLRLAQVAYNDALIGLQNAQQSQATADVAARDAYNAVANPPPGQPTPTPQQLQQARDNLSYTQAQSQNIISAAQSQSDLAKLQVDVAQAQETDAEHNLDNSVLRAPITGQVAQVNATVGQAVSVHDSNAQPLIVLENLGPIQLIGQVHETDVSNVQVGWPVNFTVRAFPQFVFTGTVASISPLPQDTPNGVMYHVTIAIAPESVAQARLFPQMSVPTISITTQEAFGAILIPIAALTFAQAEVAAGHISSAAAVAATQAAQNLIINANGDNLKDGLASFVLRWQKGKLVALSIVLGISDGTYTVVLAGLAVDQPVVVNA